MFVVEARIDGAGYRGSEDPIIEGVEFRLREGEVLVVTGKSGTGKTTLLRALAGILQGPMGGWLKGEVRLAGRPFYLPQEPWDGIIAYTVGLEITISLLTSNSSLGLEEVLDKFLQR